MLRQVMLSAFVSRERDYSFDAWRYIGFLIHLEIKADSLCFLSYRELQKQIKFFGPEVWTFSATETVSLFIVMPL